MKLPSEEKFDKFTEYINNVTYLIFKMLLSLYLIGVMVEWIYKRFWGG